MVVLAGGMATRFGGGVKAVAEAVDGRSFLDVKLGETQRLGDALGAEIPVALMTSFATDEVVRAHVAERGLGQPLVFRQTAAPRLRPDGSLFLGRRRERVALRARPRRPAGVASESSGTLDELVAPGRPLGRRLERRQPRRAHRSRRSSGCTSSPARRSRSRSSPRARTPAARRRGWTVVRSSSRRCASRPTSTRAAIPVFNTNTSLIDGRGARRAGRPHLARRREAGRRCDGRCSSSACTTSSRPRADDVPRRPAPRAREAASCPSRSRRISRRSQPLLREMLARASCFAAARSSASRTDVVGRRSRGTDEASRHACRHEVAPSRPAGPTVGGWISSTWCCRAGAASAAVSATRSVPPASHGSCDARRPGVSAAVHPGPGRCVAAPSAAGGGWRLQRPRRARLRGRRAGVRHVVEGAGEAGSRRRRRRRSSSPRSRSPASTSSRSFPATATGGSREATPRPPRWRAGSPRPGRSRVAALLRRRPGSPASATCPARSAARTSRARSRPRARRARPRLSRRRRLHDRLDGDGCATALRRAGARRVEVVCLARAVR